MSIKGIDISHYQAAFKDMSQLKADGYDFIIAKLTEGVSYTDKAFSDFHAQAKANNIPIGAYVYSHAEDTDGAAAEAYFALTVLDGKQLDLPIFIDMEKDSITWLGKSNLTEIALAFCRKITAAGYKAGVYANRNWWNNYLNADKIREAGYIVWCAAYNNSGAGIDCDIWQNSDSGRISNYNGGVDTNVMYNEALLTGSSSEIPNNSQADVTGTNDGNMVLDMPLIRKGSTGVYVKVAQLMLNAKGYNCGTADGDFGTRTDTALKAFQKKNGLTADGIAGAMTWPVLLSK